jgi:transposase
MRLQARVTFAMRDLDRLKVIQAVIDGDLKSGRAAERLGLTSRQVQRLANRYRSEGPVGLTSRKFNRPSNNLLDGELKDRVLAILRDQYADFGPTLAAEKLRTRHGIDLAKETIRRLQMASGMWVPRKLRPPKVHQPRLRRACAGELVQIDGCEHRWFEDRAPTCTTLVYVDDATSALKVIEFVGSESTFGYFEATKQYLLHYGKPMAFYSDKATVFRVNRVAASGPSQTQFARALYELNIDTFCANSPSAKGRVERAHLTLQDRLVKELRLQGISTIDAANAFMPTFIADYNKRFAKTPRDSRDAHRPIRSDENLDEIFAWREQRKVTKSLTLHYERKLYLLPDVPELRRLIGKYLDVYQYPDGRIEIRAAGQCVPYSIYEKLGEINEAEIVDNKRLGHVLRLAQIVQAGRDNRREEPSTAHRAGGKTVQRRKVPGAKRQRELSPEDVRKALDGGC